MILCGPMHCYPGRVPGFCVQEVGYMVAMPVQASSPRRWGQVISFFGCKGGVGKTTVSMALATALMEADYKVALVDLTLRLGSDLALGMGLDADPNFADLIPDMESLVPRTMENYLLAHDSGIRLLAAPTTPDKWQRVREGHVEKAIHLLRYRFDYVIVDLASNFDSRILAVLPISSKIFALLTPDGVALQNMQSLAKLMRLLGYSGHTEILLNRWTGKEILTVAEMETIVGGDIAHVIPEVSVRRRKGEVQRISLVGMELRKHLHPIVDGLTIIGNERAGSSPGRRLFPLIPGFMRQESPREEPMELEDGLLDQEVQDLVHQRVIEYVGPTYLDYQETRSDAKVDLRVQVMQVIDDVIKEHVGTSWGPEKQQQFRQDMLDEILGLGHLETLLRDPDISEIMVNGANQIYVERQGRLILTDKRFTNDAAVTKIIERIIAPIGRRIDESSPMVDARLPDGSRVNAIIPPLALDGPMLTIRKFHDDSLGIDDLIRFGSLDQAMADFLEKCVRARLNLIVSGGTGSGKTTLLNVLSSFIPADERVLTIEDAAELQLRQPHVGRLESRPANIEGRGEVGIRDLLRNALRMRPDRIVIGEVRGSETLDMLQAMNTGHDGSMATAHANSPIDLVSRLETMVMMGGVELPLIAIREQVAAALDIIVQQGRFRDGSRKITEIAWVEGMEDGMVKMVSLFAFRQTGMDDKGSLEGTFQRMEVPDELMSKLHDRGVGFERN